MRFAPWRRGLLWLLLTSSGCQAMHSYRPTPILVRDADTKQPIPGAAVRICYPFLPEGQAPFCSTGTTGTDGIARLRASPQGQGDIVVELAANGYLTERKELTVETVQALQPAHCFEAVEKRPPAVVLELYAEPRPVIELIIPSGYRGELKVQVQGQENVPFTPGQRKFSVAVPESGVISVTGPPLLAHVWSPDFTARYANGQILSRQPKDGEAGFWWVESEGSVQCFLVGSRGEFEAFCHSQENSGAQARHSSSGGRGGGRGRHSHKDSSSGDSP